MTRAQLLTLDELVLRLTHLPERETRRAEIRRWVRHSDPHPVVESLAGLLERCMQGDAGARDTALAFADFLSYADDEDQLALEALDLAAGEGDRTGVVLLLSAHPPHRELGARARQALSTRRQAPLGMRKWKARLNDRGWLERLLADLDPEVIASVCANPRITEEDLMTVTSKRPNTPEVLDAVARSRWLASDPVRRALIQNPYARTSLAISLLPVMPPTFLAALRFSGQIHPAVVAAAEFLIALSPAIE